jgi:micrococcal nuclease
VRKHRGRASLLMLAAGGVILGAVIGVKVSDVSPTQTPVIAATSVTPETSATFTLCRTGGGTNCVVDGDTFWIGGQKVRVSDIDAPETHPPRCPFEAQLGNRAPLRLQELLNEGSIQLENGERDMDIYGRLLRIVRRDRQSLGQTLIDKGLARPWTGSRKPWC